VGVFGEQLDVFGEIDDRVGPSGVIEVTGGEPVKPEVRHLARPDDARLPLPAQQTASPGGPKDE